MWRCIRKPSPEFKQRVSSLFLTERRLDGGSRSPPEQHCPTSAGRDNKADFHLRSAGPGAVELHHPSAWLHLRPLPLLGAISGSTHFRVCSRLGLTVRGRPPLFTIHYCSAPQQEKYEHTVCGRSFYRAYGWLLQLTLHSEKYNDWRMGYWTCAYRTHYQLLTELIDLTLKEQKAITGNQDVNQTSQYSVIDSVTFIL